MEKLDWLPLYIDRLLSSPAWKHMKDYQRGWYIQLLLNCTRSKRLGYLTLDENLWKIAGAHSRPMWESHKGAVMACFKIRQCDGIEEIYNERLLSVMEEQSGKYHRKKPPGERQSNSPSRFDVDSRKTKEEIRQELPELEIRRREWEREDGIKRAKAMGFVVDEVTGACRRP
jgi:hypothetical protein